MAANDLDPEFAALLPGTPSAPASASAASGALDPDFAALLPQASSQSAPQSASASSGPLRALGLAGRAIAEGVAGLPTLAGNAGIQAGNLLNKYGTPLLQKALPYMGMPPGLVSSYRPQNQLQSIDLPGILDRAGLPRPQGLLEQGTGLIESGLLGARIPTGVPEGAPANFVSNAQQALKQRILAQGNAQGLVAPPSTVAPTFVNRLLGGIAGKQKLAQEAMQRNQSVTNTIAAQALGQNPDAPLTQGALSAIRGEAAQAGYGPIRGFGQMSTDPAFAAALKGINQSAEGANRSFPGIKPQNSDLDHVITALQPESGTFNSSDAVDALSYLRDKANDAYGAGQKSLGKAFKGASQALEDLVERNLNNAGDEGQAMLQSFRDARTQMAKTYSVGKALEGDTGDVNARKLASQAAAQRPLSGGLQTVANFSAAFPKATMVPKESFESVSPLDAYGIGLGALEGMAHGEPHTAAAIAALPFTRQALRRYLLSAGAQARAARAAPYAFKPNTGLLGALGTYGGLIGGQ